ncbi:MAG: GDSL-type esterase/lipase family protein [Verrucomicrobiales bacterium]
MKFLTTLLAVSATSISLLSAEENLKKNDRVVFLGDSITAAGVRPAGYITLAEKQIERALPDLDVELIGAGIGGHKVPDCQKRLRADVIDRQPTIVFIYIGINDVWHWTHPKVVARGKKGTTPEAFESGLRDMIKQINDAGARVILCTPTVIGENPDGTNPDDARLDQYAGISRKVATETGAQLLDLRKAFVSYLKQNNPESLAKGILTSDGVHMNDAGNELIAKLVLEALKVPSKPPQELTPSAAGDIERGRILYSQICFNCHGPKLEGGQGPSLVDSYWQHGSSPEAILQIINKGVPGSPMIGYESVFPEADRVALRDYILSEQEGSRETLRSIYPREYVKGKRFTPELFDSVESLSQTMLPENHYYMERNAEGVMRGSSKLYIKEAGKYRFSIRPIGRTSIFLNGKEVLYSDEKTDKNGHSNEAVDLEPGIHHLEIFHEEKKTHSYRFHCALQKEGGKPRFLLTGRSLQGNIPKIIKARPGEALVVRKWIQDLPPRTLLCLLPNQVIVAYNPIDARVLKAWHSASINQTPSLPDRSQKPSEINGVPIENSPAELPEAKTVRFLHYATEGETALIVSRLDGVETTIAIEPDGSQSFRVSKR